MINDHLCILAAAIEGIPDFGPMIVKSGWLSVIGVLFFHRCTDNEMFSL